MKEHKKLNTKSQKSRERNYRKRCFKNIRKYPYYNNIIVNEFRYQTFKYPLIVVDT